MIFLDQSTRMGTIYEHQGSNQLAHFKLLMIEAFWKHCNLDFSRNSNEYYNINYALGNAVDKLVAILITDYRVTSNFLKNFGDERIQLEAKHCLSKMLAEKLLEHEGIPARKITDPYTGDQIYQAQVAVITLPGLKEMREAIK